MNPSSLSPSDAILERLDQLIVATTAAGIPLRKRWLDATGVAALLSISSRTVLERLARRADFPAPIRFGHPRWKASEVLAWAEQQRQSPMPIARQTSDVTQAAEGA